MPCMDVFMYLGGLLLQAADFWLWGIVGLALLAGGVWLVGRMRFRAVARVAGVILVVLSAYLLLTSGYQFWFTHRPVPESTREVLFDGVTYSRDVRRAPRPLVIHVI